MAPALPISIGPPWLAVGLDRAWMPAQGRHDGGMALRSEKAFGLSADTMKRMQAAHDFAQVRAREGTIEVERVTA